MTQTNTIESLLSSLKGDHFTAGSSGSRNSEQAPMSEELTEERLHVIEYMNHQDNPHVSLARCRVLPGMTTELHSLSVAEWYVVESGVGMMKLGEKTFTVVAGDSVQIPMGTSQQITNDGGADLIFFSLCMPRFEWDNYRSLK